jgi:hypothetical protein
MQSSVLVCWLGFDQVGLTNLPTSAFVAHLQLFVQLNQQYRCKKEHFIGGENHEKLK